MRSDRGNRVEERCTAGRRDARRAGWLVGMAVALMAVLAFVNAPALAEWRFSAGLGASYTRSSNLRIIQPNSDFKIHDLGWSCRASEMPPYYELRLERYSSRRALVGVFAGLVHMKVYGRVHETRRITGTVDGTPVDGDVPVTDYVQKFDISHGVNFIEVGVMVRGNGRPSPSFPEGRLRPYAGLSVGPVINHPENTVLGVPYSGEFRYGQHFAGMALAGVHYGLTPRWGLYAEAKATHIPSNQVSVENGQAFTTLDSLHTVFGASYSF